MRTQTRLIGLAGLAALALGAGFLFRSGGGLAVARPVPLDGVGKGTGTANFNVGALVGTRPPQVARGDNVRAGVAVSVSAGSDAAAPVDTPPPIIATASSTLKGGVVVGGDPPAAWSINDITWPTEWPVDCAEDAPHVVYAAASESRAIIVANTIREIGGCSLRVPVVLRTKIGLAVVPASRNFEVRYEGKVVMNVTKMMKGNPPNSATHFRLIATIAASKSLKRNTWAIIFEDDAQLHPDAAKWFPDTADKVALLQHSFKMGDTTKSDRILYAHCISSMSGHADFGFAKMPKCQRLTDTDVPGVDGPGGRYGNVSFAYCPHDFRCAHAYAMTKTGAQELTNAYTMLNRGDKMCPKGVWNGEAARGHPRCSSDPMVTTRYLYDCKGTPHYCKGLVVVRFLRQLLQADLC